MSAQFSYLRRADTDALAARNADERYSERLIDARSGGSHAEVVYIRTPPGGGSPRGLHSHKWEQLFYILAGTMSIEVDGQQFDATPGDLVVFPAGMPHRNRNAGTEPTLHLAINSPLPPAKATP
jgi:mannose-6-phosphate isomerase-like protein (cupin superfamily)